MAFEMTEVQSSSLAAFGYDEEESKLRVEFNNGRVAIYSDVPVEVHEALIGASNGGSVGSTFNSLVRSAGYEFEYDG